MLLVGVRGSSLPGERERGGEDFHVCVGNSDLLYIFLYFVVIYSAYGYFLYFKLLLLFSLQLTTLSLLPSIIMRGYIKTMWSTRRYGIICQDCRTS